MRTDRHLLAALLRPLRRHVARITERADNEARAAGLTVEALPGGVRRHRDQRLDQLATSREAHRLDEGAEVELVDAGAWSTPTLVATAAAGWSQ
jgi:hypothetical protein